MLSAIRRRVTFANVVMTLALVFAMSGGAWAASKFVITSTKQIKPSVLRQLKGKAGPAGPAGPQGPAGANGKDGANGTNGVPGANGKSVTVSNATPGCEAGGTTAEVEGSGVKHEICNGKNGTTGFTKTLPHGETETGSWGSAPGPNPNIIALGVASFAIPLEAPLPAGSVHIINENGKELIFKPEPEPAHDEEVESTDCGAAVGGSAAHPQAAPGNLCFYVSESAGVLMLGGGAVSVAGANLPVFITGSGPRGSGTWAVTAPE
jgi:hypothetical protein